MNYKNTKIPIYQRFKNVKGIKYYVIKNYDDARIKDDEIRKHLEENALTSSWSGGKDSTITTELLFLDGKNPLIIYCDMGYEFNETYYYAEKMIKRWQELYNATIVVLDTQYFFLDRIFTENTKGDHKGFIRGFPITLKMSYCTRDGKVLSNNLFILENIDFKYDLIDEEIKKDADLFNDSSSSVILKKIYIGQIINVAIGYAFDEDRSVANEDGLNFIYPLKEKCILELRVLEMTKEWGLYNPYYDFYFRGGCIGCPKQDLAQLIKTIAFYPCMWSKWKLIESELYRLNDIENIANPYIFTVFGKGYTKKLNSSDLEKINDNDSKLIQDGYAKEISCNCK